MLDSQNVGHNNYWLEFRIFFFFFNNDFKNKDLKVELYIHDSSGS